MAGHDPSLTWLHLGCPWAPLSLPALPVGPASFPRLPLHCAEKAAEICSVLLSRGHLELETSTFGVPDLISLLPNHLERTRLSWDFVSAGAEISIFWQTT